MVISMFESAKKKTKKLLSGLSQTKYFLLNDVI